MEIAPALDRFDPIPQTATSKAELRFDLALGQVDQWNASHPVGSRMTAKSYESELVTRTPATVLFGHRGAVYMEGYNGYFDLRELEPAKPAP